MRREYKQEKYRSNAGKFDGNLSRRGAEGWEVISIEPVPGETPTDDISWSRTPGSSRRY